MDFHNTIFISTPGEQGLGGGGGGHYWFNTAYPTRLRTQRKKKDKKENRGFNKTEAAAPPPQGPGREATVTPGAGGTHFPSRGGGGETSTC